MAGEGGCEGGGDETELVSRFMHKFQAEVVDVGGAPNLEMSAGLLGFSAKDGVATADVGDDGVLAALLVLQRDAVLFARPSTVKMGGALGEETAEDAVFGVEDGQMLIGDGFNAVGTDGEGEGGDLGGV